MAKKIIELEDRRQMYLDLIKEQLPHVSTDAIEMAMMLASFVNRALALNRGFLSLESENNYLCAIPLVRMQVDNCIRLFAYFRMEGMNAYLKWAFSKKQLSRVQDYKTKALLTDTNIVKYLSEYFPQVDNLYKTTSGYVHFSEQIIKYTARSKPGETQVEFFVGERDEFSPEAKKNIRFAMEYANHILYELIQNVLADIVLPSGDGNHDEIQQ